MGRWQGYPKEAKGLLDMANLRYVTYHYSVAPVYIYIYPHSEKPSGNVAQSFSTDHSR